ncbi:MAG: metal ABC transporter ATP-binding protein [Verrucomicrobiae bacterium]|nr:metal ABC transporter ATP-binding protein [Verrucomicrobiae bacterium]
MRPLLQLRDLSVTFGRSRALQDVSLTLRQGERLAVVGPNGAGKTTLLRVVLGLLPPTSGERKLSTPPPTIGYVPQRLHFDPEFPLTVEEFLAINQPGSRAWFGGVPRRHRAAIQEALEQTGALDLARQRLGTCSGGELQRILIAGALLQKPQLLVLDEPSANIDRRGIDTLSELLQNLHSDFGLTLLFVSHDFHFVANLADRVACLNGEICGIGSPEEMLDEHYLPGAYRDPCTPVRAGFHAAGCGR